MYICESCITMAAGALTDYIENKLKAALQFDPDTGQPFVAIEDQVIWCISVSPVSPWQQELSQTT